MDDGNAGAIRPRIVGLWADDMILSSDVSGQRNYT